jgi:hypothetical protein
MPFPCLPAWTTTNRFEAMKSYETIAVKLTSDDIFELRRLKERAEKEAQDSFIGHDMDGGGIVRFRSTDLARDAMHATEMLNRILKQV